MELCELNIQYWPRNAIKGQTLIDLVANFTASAELHEANSKSIDDQEKEEVVTWVLYMDGSSSSRGCGAGDVITSPYGVEVSYALRFKFEAFNNEAEYEALIALLKIAKSLGREKLKIKSDF